MPDRRIREIKVDRKEKTPPVQKKRRADKRTILWSAGAFVLTLGVSLILGRQMASSPLIGSQPAEEAPRLAAVAPLATPVERPLLPRRTSYISPASPANRSLDSMFARRPGVKPDSSKKWAILAGKSAFDDSPRVVLALPAEKSVEGRAGSAVPELVLRCEESVLDVYVRLGVEPASALLATGEAYSTEGRIRLDGQDAEKVMFTRSTDGQSIFFPHPNVLLARLAKTEELLLEFVPSGARPQTTSFDLTGLDKVTPPLFEACRG